MTILRRRIGRPVAYKFSWIACSLMIGWSAPAAAQSLSVTDLGLNGSGNREWSVRVSPDPTLFSDGGDGQGLGGSLAVELAFEITAGDLLSASVNATDWPYNNFGNNPFTGSVTEGVDIDLDVDTLFASLGSEFFTSNAAVEALVIETMNSELTVVSWGGQTLFPGTLEEYIGSRVSQAGINFDGLQGSIARIGGDFDEDGDVDGDDFLAWQGGFGTNIGATHMDGDADTDGDVDGDDFLLWQSQFGFSLSPGRGSASTFPVPEPNGFTLLSLALVLVAARRSTKKT